MMACSYLSASGSGMKMAPTSTACWTPPAMPGCNVPEMEGSPMLPSGQNFMRPPGLLRLMTPPSLVPTLPGLATPSGLALTTPGLAPTHSGHMPTPPIHASTPMGHMPASTGLMPSPAALMPTPPGLMQEPALDLTTTASLKLPPKSSPSDDGAE